MPLSTALFPFLFALAVGVSLVAAVSAWTVRTEPGGYGLVVCLLGIAFWAGCVLAMTLLSSTDLTPIFLKLRILGVNLTMAGMLVAVLGYTGYDQYLTRQTVGLLAVWPVVVNLIVWLRPSLVWSTITLDPTAGMGLETTYGIGFGLHAGYSYLLVLVSIVLLIRFTLASRYVYQKQIVLVIGSIVAPLTTNIVYVWGIVDYDLTVIGFLLTGVSLSWMLQRKLFFDLKPIARDRIIETLSSGVFVLDSDNRLVDSNQRGMELLDISTADIGRPFTALLPSPAATDQFEALADSTERQTIRTSFGDQHFEIELTPLRDDRDTVAGRVFLVRDITAEKRQQERLQRQNERLDQFASVVSHDLRSPLSVASGYVGLARKSGDPAHFDEIEQSHRRMEELIDELLTFARLDDAEIETSAVDLESCVTAAWSHVKTEAADLEVDCETDIEANREYLLQLLENLIRNSVEHSSTDSQTQADSETDVTINVTVEEATDRDEQAQLVVSDDGPGIPPEERESVLKQGYTTGDGTGLGLSIVSQIASAHDWTVNVKQSDTGGAAFVFDGVDRSKPAK